MDTNHFENAMNESWTGDLFHFTSETTTESSVMVYEIVTPEQYTVLVQIIGIVRIVISFIGLFGNTINIKTFLMMGLEDGVTITFFALSLSDFGYTLVTFLQSVFALLVSQEQSNGYTSGFVVDPFAILFYFGNLGHAVDVVGKLTTTYLAVVRCLCVVKPLQFKGMFTRLRTTIVLLSIVLIAIISHAPLFSHMGLEYKFDHKANYSRVLLWLSDDRARVKDLTRFVVYMYSAYVTQIAVIVCVVIMISQLRKSVMFRKKQEIETTKKSAVNLTGKERNIVLQVIIICSISVFCNVVRFCELITNVVHPKFDMGKPYHYLYLIISNTMNLSDCINASVNFFIYFKFNSKFRSLCFAWKK